jgi:hypothetical protein
MSAVTGLPAKSFCKVQGWGGLRMRHKHFIRRRGIITACSAHRWCDAERSAHQQMHRPARGTDGRTMAEVSRASCLFVRDAGISSESVNDPVKSSFFGDGRHVPHAHAVVQSIRALGVHHDAPCNCYSSISAQGWGQQQQRPTSTTISSHARIDTSEASSN